tara:strand:- start:7406 stop:7843 length:438 start_codon:yes stop_codon:yes gene_type:complete
MKKLLIFILTITFSFSAIAKEDSNESVFFKREKTETFTDYVKRYWEGVSGVATIGMFVTIYKTCKSNNPINTFTNGMLISTGLGLVLGFIRVFGAYQDEVIIKKESEDLAKRLELVKRKEDDIKKRYLKELKAIGMERKALLGVN